MLSPERKELQAAAGLLLRLVRMSSGIEQERMASRLEVSQPTVSRWEKGRGGPSEPELSKWLALCQTAMHSQPQNGEPAAKVPALLSEKAFAELVHLLYQVYAPENLPDSDYHPSSELIPEVRRMTQQLLLADVLGSKRATTADGAGLTLLERAPSNAPALVPLYADIAAGLGEEQDARSEPRETLEVPQYIVAQDPGAYALRVRGDSMAPLLLEGDAVVVSPALLPEEGCLVAAFVDPDGDVIKRFEWAGEAARSAFRAQLGASLEGGEVARPSYVTPEALLKPENPAYPVIRIGGELGRPARIWGRVVLQLREL